MLILPRRGVIDTPHLRKPQSSLQRSISALPRACNHRDSEEKSPFW
jgi:hypothetical protein